MSPVGCLPQRPARETCARRETSSLCSPTATNRLPHPHLPSQKYSHSCIHPSTQKSEVNGVGLRADCRTCSSDPTI